MNVHYSDEHVGEREWFCLILVCVCVCVFVFWCAHNSLFRLLHAGTCSLGSHDTNSEHKQQETYFFSKCDFYAKPLCFLRCILLQHNCAFTITANYKCSVGLEYLAYESLSLYFPQSVLFFVCLARFIFVTEM